MTAKERKDFMQMYNALKRIGKYQTSIQLKKSSQKQWGLEFEDALEMAYDNIQQEANDGIKNVRLPKITTPIISPNPTAEGQGAEGY